MTLFLLTHGHFRLQPWILIWILGVFLLSSSVPAYSRTVKSRKTAVIGAGFEPGKPSQSRKAVGATRRGRRHRRLRVSRSLKPMPPLNEAPFSAQVPLLPVIEDAKSQLEKETARYTPGGRKSHPRREVKLALANFKTGEIKIVPGTEMGGRLTLEDPTIRFEVDWWNGFNSSTTILEPPNTAVVAMLYALEPERQKFLRQDAIIYTPYSSALLQTELVEAGKNYLMDKIHQARVELGRVPSRAFPGMTLANSPGFSDEDYFNLILTEQMDPGRFRSIAAGVWELNEEQEGQLLRLGDRILAIIGANQEDAYSFTGNYASARGLTQFTPIGMSVVWNQYVDSGIPHDFREATSSHLNAIKAEICLLDHDLAELARCHPPLIGSGMEIYAAGASYNGGPSRVRYGLENFGLTWFHPVSRLTELEARKTTLSRTERQECLWLSKNRSHETFVYLNKIHAIRRSRERLSASQNKAVSPPEPDQN